MRVIPSRTGLAGDASQGRGITVAIADLMPLVHARDAAQAKIAAIGSVNPRRGGLVNGVIQGVKKNIARALQWFVRDQITFNRETVSALEAVIEALNEHNRALVSLATQMNERADQLERLEPELRELKDIRSHWAELRANWESKVGANEIQFLRSVADLQGAFQHRVHADGNQLPRNRQGPACRLSGRARPYHGRYSEAASGPDFQKVRAEYGQMIHDELRIIRMRQPSAAAGCRASRRAGCRCPSAAGCRGCAIDSRSRLHAFRISFSRPRGTCPPDRRVLQAVLRGCRSVLDIGCGRGEFLDLMREMGVPARGIDLGEESVAQCHEKGLKAEVADLFAYLGPDTSGEFDGIFASQLVEHLDPATPARDDSAVRRESAARRHSRD